MLSALWWQYYENRLGWVNGLKSQSVNPYPHKFEVTMLFPAFHAKYGSLENSAQDVVEVSIAGRVSNIRSGGKGLVFYDLSADGLKLQVGERLHVYLQLLYTPSAPPMHSDCSPSRCFAFVHILPTLSPCLCCAFPSPKVLQRNPGFVFFAIPKNLGSSLPPLPRPLAHCTLCSHSAWVAQVFADARKFTEFSAMGDGEGLVAFMKLANSIKRGDIVGAKGVAGKTKVSGCSVLRHTDSGVECKQSCAEALLLLRSEASSLSSRSR